MRENTVSKSREDKADFRGGSESLFRAVRADHEASAADYARVEAELARRIAIGASPKISIDGVESVIAKPAPVLTPGMIAKLSIGLSLLAAGSFAIVRVIDSAPSPASRVTSAPAPVSARAAGTPQEEKPEAPSAESADSPSTQSGLRSAPSDRVEAPRTAQRESASHKRSSASHTVPARSDFHVANEANANEAASLARSDPSDADDATTPAAASIRRSASSAAKKAIAPTAARVAHAANAPTAASVNARAASSNSPSPRQPASKPTARPTAQPHAAAELETSPAPTETGARTSTRAQPVPVRVDDSADARDELVLVERMHAALRAGKPAAALELSAEHAKRWPHGSLSEERDAVSAIASCALHKDDAAARAKTFLSKYPHAPTAPRVLGACAPLSAATKPAPSH
jgi:hypothetical protein